MLKKLLLAAALALPATAHAQVDYQFTNFQNTGRGFTTTLLFRNTNKYTDPYAVYINPVLIFTISPRAAAICGGSLFCEYLAVWSGGVGVVGNVERDTFNEKGTLWVNNFGAGSDACAAGCGILAVSFDDAGAGVLGCHAGRQNTATFPDNVRFYTARTCAADGYDGWVSVPVAYMLINPGAPVTYDVSDINVAFTTTTITPEPATWVLLAVGLGALGIARRRGRAARA